LDKAFSAYAFANKKYGVSQTASVKSPYIYAEDNWEDDMELAGVAIYNATRKWMLHTNRYLGEAFEFGRKERITPWFGADTAKHYQWYPFNNIGHYELAKGLKGNFKDTIIGYYKEGIQRVWNKAQQNAFYRRIPCIWYSNNLTTSFPISVPSTKH